MSDPRMVLRLALASLFESSRKHPGKFQTLYYNMPSHFSVEQILSKSSISQNASMYGYNEDEDEKWLLDEAEQSYNKIIDAITNSCINEVPNDTESLSLVVQAPDLHATEIFDTGDLTQVNFVYNNITFQVHPSHKISNE